LAKWTRRDRRESAMSFPENTPACNPFRELDTQLKAINDARLRLQAILDRSPSKGQLDAMGRSRDPRVVARARLWTFRRARLARLGAQHDLTVLAQPGVTFADAPLAARQLDQVRRSLAETSQTERMLLSRMRRPYSAARRPAMGLGRLRAARRRRAARRAVPRAGPSDGDGPPPGGPSQCGDIARDGAL
jgi:hypothetical protein